MSKERFTDEQLDTKVLGFTIRDLRAASLAMEKRPREAPWWQYFMASACIQDVAFRALGLPGADDDES